MKTFDDIWFIDETHRYFSTKHPDVRFTSVTTFISKFKPEFQEDYWLAYKVLEQKGPVKSHLSNYVPEDNILFNGHFFHYEDVIERHRVDVEKLRNRWKYDSHIGKDRGTNLHAYMEGLASNKKLFIPEEYKFYSDVCDRFFNEEKPSALYPEWIIGDIDIKIAGQVDLFTSDYYIYDYKFNEKFEHTNKYGGKLLPPLSHLDDCELNHYYLQLNLYKWIIEKNTGIEVSGCKIVHVLPSEYKIYDVPDMSTTIVQMLQYDNRTSNKYSS